MKKSIIILVFSGHQFGGMERRFSRLASYLIANQKNVRLFCTSDALRAINEIGIPFPEFNSSGERSIFIIDKPSIDSWFFDKLNRIKGLLRLLLILSKNKKSVHVHLAMNPGLISFFFSFTKIKYSLSIVNSNLCFKYFYFWRSIIKAQAVDCLSESIYKELILMSKSFSLPSVFVSPCSFTDNKRAVVTVCQSSSSKRDIDVALIAREVPGKGHALFRKALNSLAEIKYHNKFTNDPFEIMRRSKIFLSLQEKENYPSQALLEAMVSGCAIIATDVGETRKLLDETCAVLIPYDPVILAETITYLLKNHSHRKKMAENAQRKALSEHTVDRFSNYFLQYIIGIK
jgi:glycosyltransferase involved in cell wall biosynthesis